MSVKVIDKIEVCSDCLMAIANNDFTSLDYHYGKEEGDKKQKAIIDGMNTLTEDGKNHLALGDDTEGSFNWRGCDCCNDGLGGDKYEVIILG